MPKNGDHTKAPKSYVNARRPELNDAAKLEFKADKGLVGMDAVIARLEEKGYFAPLPRPWKLGFKDRGMGRGDFAVLDRFGDLVAEVRHREDAALVIAAVNSYRRKATRKKKK